MNMIITIKQLKALIKEQVDRLSADQIQAGYETRPFRSPTSVEDQERLDKYRLRQLVRDELTKLIKKYGMPEVVNALHDEQRDRV